MDGGSGNGKEASLWTEDLAGLFRSWNCLKFTTWPSIHNLHLIWYFNSRGELPMETMTISSWLSCTTLVQTPSESKSEAIPSSPFPFSITMERILLSIQPVALINSFGRTTPSTSSSLAPKIVWWECHWLTPSNWLLDLLCQSVSSTTSEVKPFSLIVCVLF